MRCLVLLACLVLASCAGVVPDDSSGEPGDDLGGGAGDDTWDEPGSSPPPGQDGAVPARDCRDDFPEIAWSRKFESECAKCYDCPGEGWLPGVAFMTCKIGPRCVRFATVDNCNYDLCPRGACTLPVHNPDLYCRKDGINYTYFVCRVGGAKVKFQTIDGTLYYDKNDVSGDVAYQVADALPITGGCASP